MDIDTKYMQEVVERLLDRPSMNHGEVQWTWDQEYVVTAHFDADHPRSEDMMMIAYAVVNSVFSETTNNDANDISVREKIDIKGYETGWEITITATIHDYLT